MHQQSSKKIGRTFPIMETFDLFTPEMLSDPMSCAEAFPAKTLATQGNALESTENAAAYGLSTLELLASYDPITSSWKTSQLCLDGELSEFSATWPRSGMTRNGVASPLPTLARRTAENVSGLWPTPQASDTRDRGNLSSGAIKRRREKGKQIMLSQSVSEVSGNLNPTWVEWLMGFPLGWTALDVSAMPSSRKSRKSSDAQS